ncbi:MAG: hypothetical protein Q7R41_02470, partial [Phycisphaerales bacterium]|nr:hypothetical protein [Phycisphaerales bacterium]
MGESDARARQLADNVGSLIRECTAQIARWEGGQSAVVDAMKRLDEVSDTGSRISMELARLVERGAQSVSALSERIEKSGEIRERMEGFVARLDVAGELDAGLQNTVVGGRSLRDELSSLIEQSGRQQDLLKEANTSLQEMIRANERVEQGAKETVEQVDARVASLSEADASLHALAETHKQIEHSAHEAVERMDSYLTLLKETMETGEPLLNEFQSRIGAMDMRLTRLGDRSAEIERKIGEGTVSAKAVVANAQSQAEHLDRVCTAVRKVFAGLSQASLEAHDQTEGLRRAGAEARRQLLHLTTESERAAKTLHEWLEEALRVQSRLERVLDQSPSVSQTHPIEPLRSAVRKLGSVERSATINVEDEPGAAKAREIDAGLDRMAIREPAARADEIARLIAEAKAAKAEALAPT